MMHKYLLACLVSLPCSVVWADGGAVTPLLPKMEQECAACHIAFRPNFLPRSSWQKVMGSLDKHYGVDASLPDADTQVIADWLNSVAQELGEVPPNNRITESFWFKRKHGNNHVKADVWLRDSVKSRANCQACHANAALGDFNEHNIRIPR